VPSQLYAVFRHEGHVASISGTMAAILNGWFPDSGYQPGDAPICSNTGTGLQSHAEESTEGISFDLANSMRCY